MPFIPAQKADTAPGVGKMEGKGESLGVKSGEKPSRDHKGSRGGGEVKMEEKEGKG